MTCVCRNKEKETEGCIYADRMGEGRLNGGKERMKGSGGQAENEVAGEAACPPVCCDSSWPLTDEGLSCAGPLLRRYFPRNTPYFQSAAGNPRVRRVDCVSRAIVYEGGLDATFPSQLGVPLCEAREACGRVSSVLTCGWREITV